MLRRLRWALAAAWRSAPDRRGPARRRGGHEAIPGAWGRSGGREWVSHYGSLQYARQSQAPPVSGFQEEELRKLLGVLVRLEDKRPGGADDAIKFNFGGVRIDGALRDARPSAGHADPEEDPTEGLLRRQRALECRALFDAVEKYKRALSSAREREMLAAMPTARRMLVEWFGPLRDSIREQQQRYIDAKIYNYGTSQQAPIFVLLPPEELAVLTMHSLLSAIFRGDEADGGSQISFVRAAKKVARSVQSQVTLLHLKAKIGIENKKRRVLNRLKKQIDEGKEETEVIESHGLDDWEVAMLKSALKLQQNLRMVRNRWNQPGVTMHEVNKHAYKLPSDVANWDERVMLKVGASLIDIFRKVATIKVHKPTKRGGYNSMEPAITHEIQWTRYAYGLRCIGLLKCHPKLVEWVESEDLHPAIALERASPMLVPPRPWRSCMDGGYLTIKSCVMKNKGEKEQMAVLKKADEYLGQSGGPNAVYEALNVLGNTPWQINKEMLKIVETVWANGGGMLDLPSKENLPMPVLLPPQYRLLAADGALHARYAYESRAETYNRKLAVKRIRKRNRELHSMRCDLNLKLSVAKEFQDEEAIYFPHSIDFRGRAYPIPPHLNHLGSDVCRSLLQFAVGRPLGPSGLDWLLIQVANLYGQGADKLPLHGRRKFGEEHLEMIIDSAENPLDGMQWWMQGSEPWQLLATCKDVRNAYASGNPETYCSKMHVHQDGSCNGLQHYAALGRDEKGGTAVNLVPADAPQDPYTQISHIVQKRVVSDVAKGLWPAQSLQGQVDRKLVKQTVMTSVYGVTFVGARDQIANRLQERGWDDEHTVFRTSSYAATVTLDGLNQMFKSAKEIMRWLGQCASLIADRNKTVMWRTPLGLPATQPYKREGSTCVRTVLQQLRLSVPLGVSAPVQKRRQKTAFPPNYIHSLDSTHMMMTALGCHEAGIEFAGVHDSFWTHAGTVDSMNAILREKFTELHSKPLLQMLRDDLQRQHPGVDFPPVPPQGNLDLDAIQKSVYFFS
ncbi:unnamed protein product [Ostreobium quekettii]|uniref:DNA-directed RNA polymerase, mitochondrial n=1 Tax=Ostreobium quekettii TaxID=121088 RepID=A0A8S1J5U7_9CHLO|nr:unnamed protein product [Ostreobium quekettii]